eukprot:TRINITY_DN5743_c0_g1_i13.p2 TRINITY_DN5743_c0_g1~~TRINITY_DN5743_c0_g1_i13.p2  ORF type:complete len:110 (-),score=27.60 TRINITY_DN5743_c0_g1_i13:453-782(-)
MTCYNISSPCPIVIPPTGTENMLRFAEQMYFQKQVVIEENTVKLPKLCHWYIQDFGINRSNVIEFLTPLLNMNQAAMLALVNPSELNLVFLDYNWDLYIDPTLFHYHGW